MIDERWLDIDFTKEERFTFGAKERASDVFAGPSFSDTGIQLIPRSQWRSEIEKAEATGITLERCVSRIFDQGQEGSCHTPDTEVLTEHGWKSWSDYNWHDSLGTMNRATGLLEFQRPTQRHVYDYDGEMIYSSHRRLDFAVTANHRMLVRRWNERQRTLNDSYEFVDAGRLGWYAGLPHSTLGQIGAEFTGITIDGDCDYGGDDFVALCALVCSDGWAGNSEHTRNRVSFCCFNELRQPMIRRFAEKVGFTEQPGRPGVWYRQNAARLAAWMRANLYVSDDCCATSKRVPGFVMHCTPRQIQVFLKYFGDQSHTREHGAQFYTSSKRMADDLQELHLRIGKRAIVHRYESRKSEIKGRAINSSDSWLVSVAETNKLSLTAKDDIEHESYRGPVYCATVPNGTLVTRRNGKLLISGNCVANATSQAHEICQAQQFGRDNVVLLSAISLYKRIGSSPNSGAMIDDALDEIRKGGILPLDNEENRRAFGGHVMPATGFHTRWPSGDWQSTARKFAGGEAFIIQDFDEMISVVLSGFPVVVGREGHSICYVRPTYDSRGNVVMKYANSWAPDWGDSGYGYDSQRQIEKSAQWAFGLRTVTNPYANQFSFSV